ncbi:phosphotransferase family protein [Enhygromyxa salina]|uniref:Phosphotransferase enzyme family protein n=1 Tax=Enhygromyxa salina TaxID=215803 RepID=A0A2S9YT97_9BACT|nr:phosphotransferase [Enhygromyxa salina]PRQ08341.1 Phosphotransferase enzyme family protein [Enhygromyxa salina]
MFVVAQTVIHHLLARDLLDAADVVAGRVVVHEQRRRNNNLVITVAGRRGLFLKQVASAAPEHRETLAREAWVYRMIAAHGHPRLVAVAPRLLDYADERSVLVTELVSPTSAAIEAPAVAAALGRALAVAHTHGQAIVQRADDRLPRIPPSVLLLADPTTVPSKSVHVDIVRAIQELPALGRELEQLRHEWRGEALIHGDMKWDNAVLTRGLDGSASMVIVDWELADVGDEALDIAGILQWFLHAWVRELGSADATAAAELRRSELDAFWSAYVDQRGLEAPHGATLLHRSTRLAGARLIQSAIEAQPPDLALAPPTIVLLQFALNVMRNPDRARRRLLGVGDRISTLEACA